MLSPHLLCSNRKSLSDLCLSQHSSLQHEWLQKDLQTGPLHYSPGSQSSHAGSVQSSPKLLPKRKYFFKCGKVLIKLQNQSHSQTLSLIHIPTHKQEPSKRVEAQYDRFKQPRKIGLYLHLLKKIFWYNAGAK